MTNAGDGDEEELIDRLAQQLTHARQRGLDDLDLEIRGHQHRVAAPDLEALARSYSGDRQTARLPLVRRLLRDALKAWEEAGYRDEAAFIRRLFFTNGSPSPKKAGDLLDAARLASGLDDTAFRRRQRSMFRRFARHLVDFVRTWQADPSDLADGSKTPTGATDNPLSFGVQYPIFRFDGLGGGSQVIRVYPGVGESLTDRTANGTFFSGDVVRAVCKTRGRTVQSHPEVGERMRGSDIWIRIVGSPGLTQFATLTYGDMTRVDLDRLPDCGI